MSNTGIGGVGPSVEPNSTIGVMRFWLMRAPKPAKLVVYCKDGREATVELNANTSWVQTANSVLALLPERIEAMSSEDKLIRACIVDDLLRKEEIREQQQAAAFTALTTSDPETQRLIAISEIIARSHERATQAIENTMGIAFSQLQEICNGLAQQANAAQQSANELSVAIRNLMIQQANDAMEESRSTTEGPLEQMAAHFLSGAAAGEAAKQQQPPTNGKPNGRH